MKTVIYICIIIIIVCVVIQSYYKLKETFNTCNIYTHPDNTDIQWFCSSKYANLGELQLVHAIHNPSTTDNDKVRLKTIYNFKKENNILNIPCHYSLDKLTRPYSNTQSNEIYRKIHIDNDQNIDDGETYTWARCYYNNDMKSNNMTNKSIIHGEDGKYISFLKTDLASIKDDVCKNKSFYMEEKPAPCNTNEDCVFLQIECMVIDVDEPHITLKAIKFVKYNVSTKQFEPIKNSNTCYVQNFMTMTYNNRNVYYIPYRTRRSAVIIDKDLCGHYTVKETPQPFDFDLSMIGIKDTTYVISKHLYGIKLDNIPHHPYGYAEHRNDEDELRVNLITYKTNIVGTFKNRYTKCERRKKTQIDSMYKSSRSVRRLEQELRKILQFIELLEEYIKEGKPLDRRLVARESGPYRYCRYSLTNPKDVDELYNNLKQCKTTLNEQSGYHPEFSEKKQELEGYIKKIEDFFKYVDENKLRETAVVPAGAIYQLKKYKDAVAKVCVTDDNSTFTMRTVTRKLKKIESDISTKGITDEFLDNLGDMQLVIKPELLKYISNDNCVYIQLNMEDVGTCSI